VQVQAPLHPRVAAVPSPVFPSLALSPAPEAAPSALARLSAEAVQPVVLRPGGSEASAQQVVALQPGEPAAQDAPVLPEEAVAAWVAVEVPLQAAAVPGAVAEQQPAAQDVEVLQLEAQGVEVLQPEVPGDRAAEPPSAVLPSVLP
jgi:hypothetical protein